MLLLYGSVGIPRRIWHNGRMSAAPAIVVTSPASPANVWHGGMAADDKSEAASARRNVDIDIDVTPLLSMLPTVTVMSPGR